MTVMMEFADKNIKIVIISVVHMFKKVAENTDVMKCDFKKKPRGTS